MTRRSNGEGSYFLRSDGRHAYRLRWNGERHDFTGRTKKEARDKMKAAVKRLEAGMPARDSRVTLADWLERWRGTQLAARNLKPTTRSAYETLSRIHLEADAIGKITLDKLKPSHVDALILRLRSKELAESTIRQVYHVLRIALDAAVRDEILGKNPTERVQRPVPSKAEARHLSPAEVGDLLEAARPSRYHAVLALIAATGLRRGEALALTWDDVDLVERSLTVRGTLARVDGKLTVTTPKTERSRRTVGLAPAVVDLLARHKDAQEADAKEAGSEWADSGHVFTTEFGKPVDPRTVFRTLQAAAKKAKLEGIGVHTLRHSMASALMAQGANIKDVSEILGHSSVAITGDIYVHTTADSKRETMCALASLLGPL